MSIIGSFKRLTIDNDANCVEVETAAGVVHRASAGALSEASISLPRDFRRITFVPAEGALILTTPSGEELVVEVFDGQPDRQRRAGRPVVYLENHWVTLARSLHSPDRVSDHEVEAAHELIRLARGRRVILPLSSGHMIETARSDRTWRQHLAPLMVALSHGWLMRDPLLVRRSELGAIFAARAGREGLAAPAVITLDSRQLYAEDMSPAPYAADLPSELATLSATLASVTSIYAVLIEDEVTHSAAGYAAAASWASSHHDLAKELRSNTKARHLSRDVTRAWFLSDLGMDLHIAVAESGLTPEEFGTWLTEFAEADLAAAPYLGRMRDVIHMRLRNDRDVWEPNDLIDMLFLPCAAAYAAVVVSERKTGDYLARVHRSRADGARIVTSFAQLIDAVGELTAHTACQSAAGGTS